MRAAHDGQEQRRGAALGAALRAGAAASVGLLGIWCYIAFSRTNDAFAHLISFSMTIAYVVGIFGRNFGNSRSVIIQILCAWVPITAALLLHGDIYHWIFAVLLGPFFLAVKFIAERLRLTCSMRWSRRAT